MKNAKFWSTLAVGLVLAGALMLARGIFEAENAAEAVMAISDGFAGAGLLYLAIGILIWVSSTDVLDIFGYAFKKAAHALIPGMVDHSSADFYEYKMKKKEKRKKFTQYAALIWGVVFIVISLILTAVWYGLAD